MSVLGDAMNAVRQVILLQARMDQLEDKLNVLTGDVDGLTDALAGVRDRIARLEGMIEGMAFAAGARATGGGQPPRLER